MIRLYQVILFCYMFLIVFLLVDFSDANANVRTRPKRFLSFRNISHFFLRLNTKAQSVAWTAIFAQAVGFRLNWDEPPDSFHPYHHLQRRALYRNIELIMDKNGLNGFHCIRRAICEMRSFSQPTEIYHKILKMVFSQRTSATDKWHNVTDNGCLQSIHLCPLSFLDISLYTDL